MSAWLRAYVSPPFLEHLSVRVGNQPCYIRIEVADAGRQLMSWSDNPDVSPSLWFVGDSGPEWVVVAVARYCRRSPGSRQLRGRSAGNVSGRDDT